MSIIRKLFSLVIFYLYMHAYIYTSRGEGTKLTSFLKIKYLFQVTSGNLRQAARSYFRLSEVFTSPTEVRGEEVCKTLQRSKFLKGCLTIQRTNIKMLIKPLPPLSTVLLYFITNKRLPKKCQEILNDAF